MLYVEEDRSPQPMSRRKCCKRTVQKRNPIWKKIDVRQPIPQESDFEDVQVTDDLEDLSSPFQCFRRFVDSEFLDLIVEKSNLYSVQKNVNRPLKLSREELEQWLGLSVWFSLYKITDTHLHSSQDMKNDKFTGVMTCDRWEEIKTNIHFVDNSEPPGDDKIAKIRPFVEHLRNKFRKIPMIRDLCIDESIIPFKGHSSLKHYNPKKPHKWGYKFFLLADKKGMVYDFIPYSGKIVPVDDPNVPDLGASSNVVLHLAQNIPNGKGYRLYYDNWFTSLPLQVFLAKRQIWSCGTVQSRRLPGLTFTLDKAMQAKGRGTFEEWDTYVDGERVTAVKWYDNKGVHTLSTFATAHPVVQKERFDRRRKENIVIQCPSIVHEYNQAMGGVDLHDQYIALYRFSFKSKKYYMRLVWHLFDMALVNAYLIYKRSCNALHIPAGKQNKLAQFKYRVAKCLMFSCKITKKGKRGRPSIEAAEEPLRKRITNQGLPLPENDIRFDGLDHLPNCDSVRHMCKINGCKSRVITKCSKCNVHLCITQKRNCFVEFHTKNQ